MEAVTTRAWCPRGNAGTVALAGLLMALAASAFLFFSGGSGDSPKAASAAAPADDQGGIEFDPAKVWTSNLGAQRRRVVVAIWSSGGSVDLDSLLAGPKERGSVSWRADNQPLPQPRLPFGDKPADDHVRTVLLAATASGRSGSFALVVVPPATRDRFAEFIARESKDTAWMRNLPPVYARLGPNNSNPEPQNCKPRLWPHLRQIRTHYHPGAAFELRSEPHPDGSGHQATYDASGALLREGTAAGSADRGSPTPSYSLSRLKRHKELDVVPYLWAAQLDGNPVNPKFLYRDFDGPLIREGDHIRQYIAVRPVFGPSRKEVEPGKCAASVLE